jgi:hypothetical protein
MKFGGMMLAASSFDSGRARGCIQAASLAGFQAEFLLYLVI